MVPNGIYTQNKARIGVQYRAKSVQFVFRPFLGEIVFVNVIWREFYSPEAVAQLTAMGTLPRYEFELEPTFGEGPGWYVAKQIAKSENDSDPEAFVRGGAIVILEPAELAGVYDITCEYEPYFYASQRTEPVAE